MKFYWNLCCNRLPQYFSVYHNVTQEYNFSYNLRTRPLRIPFTRHVYAESCLKFQLVKILNDTDKSILQMIENQTHSYICFNNIMSLDHLLISIIQNVMYLIVMYAVLLTHKLTIIIMMSVKYTM